MKEKVAVVTGASNGIGKAIARRFASEGASVAILDVDETPALDLAGSLPDAQAFIVDVTDEHRVQEAVDAIAKRWGGIDILVNNAGGALMPLTPFWEFSTADFVRVSEVNFLSQWICAKAALPALRAAQTGSIVNIASLGGYQPIAGVAPYSAAKAAVINLTQTMAKELGKLNIRVNAIAPGYIRFTRRKAVLSEAQVAEMERNVFDLQILRRIGQPEDVAGVAAFLCSLDASHITGQVITVSGGSL